MPPSKTPKDLRVLISGIGIAGPVVAYWLAKAGVSVTVLERYDKFRKEGQTIDIRNEGITIMKWMGVEEEIRKRTTKELGIKFVDSQNQTWAAFPQDPDGSFTSEFEIVRSELASTFYDAAKDKVEYIFGDSIESLQDTEDLIEVTLQKDKSRVMKYDILVVAEGLTSRTRAKAFDEDVRAPIRSLNLWAASFSYPQGESDEQWARWYQIPKRRGILVRPDGFGRVRAMIMCINDSESIKLVASSRTSTEKQKEYFIDCFKGTGWESDRVLEGLRQADDLYVQEIAQTKAKSWSKGRVVLVGDTAYCPSAITGLGTTAAITGTYILAAEIVKNPGDHRAALTAYENTLRPWIDKWQSLMPGVPNLMNPETEWGIRCLRFILYLISWLVNSRLFKFSKTVLSAFGPNTPNKSGISLPDPSIFEQI